ncbi:asparaginase [Amycolatopsis vancoresmycina]|uniref:L-asparaginase n=1 Tax=Amycolatopsis vancoresmycina DSM 44592 TaxID=1292037 RepID=R1FUV1_9PSEU|nr:asparaginase [Amycolatopsis vancoresmycina]EOD63187.1 L-asparaginase [Amycolatopsis vancoresmycina DSM 44592]
MPLIALASLGGTISMAPDGADGGAVPRLGAADLLGGLGDLPMDVLAETLAGIGSASMDFATLLRCRDWGLRQDADGLVVVQGTDTLEETAYFLDLTWPSEIPVVVTGAMRNAGLFSPDGPANLRNALTVAADPRSRGRGALVTLNDDVHAARWVRKAHSSRLDAFSSAPAGPLGMVVEHAVHWFHPSPPRPPALTGVDFGGLVPVVEAGLDDSGAVLSSVAAQPGVRGVVVAATGVGHVSSGTADVIARLVPSIPVVVASRTGAGPTLRSTYGFQGSESSLIAMGATMAGWLDARKARILLHVLLASGADRDRIEREFRRRGDLD